MNAPGERKLISAAEWRWLAVVSVIVMALFSAPYIVGWLHHAPSARFGGFLFALDDMHSYIAKMRYGAYDGWLLHIVYTTEPHAAGFAYVQYIALGKLAAWISGQGQRVSIGTLIAAYHVARVVFGLGLLAVLYCFVADFVDGAAQRRLAWALGALAGGLGWIPVVLSRTGAIHAAVDLPVEFYVPEAFTILLLYGLPHLALARSLLLGGWLLMFRAADRRDWRRAALAGLVWGVMGVIVPFYAALLGVLALAWLAALWIGRRRLPWAEARLAALAGLIPAGLVAYNAWLFTANPVFASWGQQNALPSPPLPDFVMAFGVLVLLALPDLVGLLRRPITHRTALLLTWPPVALLMAYLPVGVQRRLLEGVIAPLAVLAAMGMWRLLGEKSAGATGDRPSAGYRLRQLALSGAVLLIIPSTLLLLGGGALTATVPDWPIYHSSDELAALDWLRQNAPIGSVVLSSSVSGNELPAYAGVRVYVGHGPETVDYARKQQQADAFFLGEMSDDARRALLDAAGVDYVWVGPPETPDACSAACFDASALGLSAALQQGAYTIYAVSR